MICPTCNSKLTLSSPPSRIKENIAGFVVGVVLTGLYFFFYGFYIASYQADTALKAQSACEDKLIKYAETVGR